MRIPTEVVERLFTLGDAGLFAWANETGWPVTDLSPNISTMLGVQPENLESGRVLFASLVHPDDLGPLRLAVQQAVDTGADKFVQNDYRLRGANGRWIWAHIVAIVERDDDGTATSFVGYLFDVTVEKGNAAALAQQRDRLQLVLEGTRLGLWDWNPQTNEVVFDERWAQMLGHELAEIEPSLESWQSRVHPDDLAACYADIQAHIDGKTDFYENVHRMRHRDGHWLYILDRGRICERDAEGRATRFTGTHTDITQQKRAELEARRANRAKSEFLARMSHEIRTPLNGVLGILQLLQATGLDELQHNYIDVIRESGDTLLTIINDVLDTSKIEVGELQIEARGFDVRRTLQTIHDLYRERALSKGIEYRLSISPEVPRRLVGDAHRIRQVLSNLLSNAFKFTGAGAVELAVTATPLERDRVELTLCVRDTGCGIEDVDAVWEPFRQGDVSTSRRHGGTGLGLSICRQLSHLMGGTIEASSAVGDGTEFTVRLALQVDSSPDAPTAPARELTDDLPTLDVLVAEDNAVNQMVIFGMLDKLGQRVTMVENGVEAVGLCRAESFDLVLMDIHMPEMDGIEACRSIRAGIPQDRQPRVFAISADAFAPGDEKYQGAGFDGAVAKPFKLVDIARVIRAANSVD